jgi:hypothetical protein
MPPMDHWEISFDEHGKPNQGEADAVARELPGEDLTDLFVFSHGWNNDRGQAPGCWSSVVFAAMVPLAASNL